MNALTNDFPASAAIDVKPKKTAAKYSGGPKRNAALLNGIASATITAEEIRPPVSAATSAHPSAFAASPRCVIAYPSHSNGTSIGSPGMRYKIAVKQPAYVPET